MDMGLHLVIAVKDCRSKKLTIFHKFTLHAICVFLPSRIKMCIGLNRSAWADTLGVVPIATNISQIGTSYSLGI
jgi:hypothetical protein